MTEIFLNKEDLLFLMFDEFLYFSTIFNDTVRSKKVVHYHNF